MKLLLPLKYYDEAGRVLPPSSFWWCLLWMARSYFVFVAALSFRQDSKALLTLFYPDHRYFYAGLALGAPAIIVTLVCSFRERIWRAKLACLFVPIKYLLALSLVLDMIFHLLMADNQNWLFSWLIALSLLLDIACLFYIAKDRHLAFMFYDWQKIDK